MRWAVLLGTVLGFILSLLLLWFILDPPLATKNLNPFIYSHNREIISTLIEDSGCTVQILSHIFCWCFLQFYLLYPCISSVLTLDFSSSGLTWLTFIQIYCNVVLFRCFHWIFHVCYRTHHIFWIVNLSLHVTL